MQFLQLDGTADNEETPGRTLRRSSRAAARREKEAAQAKEIEKNAVPISGSTANGKSTPKRNTKGKASPRVASKKVKVEKMKNPSSDNDADDDEDSDAPQRSFKRKFNNPNEDDTVPLNEMKLNVKSKKKVS